MKLFSSFFFIVISFFVKAQRPTLSSGTIQRFENFPSKFVAARNVDVWLPENYSSKKKYAVLYMHDGAALFDSSLAFNHQEWGVDETVSNLLKEKKIKDVIVVGIWNVPTYRFANYFPQKVIDSIDEPARTAIITKQIKLIPDADKYLMFIVTELKPFIDSAYSAKKDVNNTFIMGSSMGGLISAYALCEYPNVFGGAACLSIHTPLAAFELMNEHTDKEAASKFRNYLSAHLPKANTRKIYFDYGDKDFDSSYQIYQTKVDTVMKQKGWVKKFWRSKYFPGAGHNEKSWAKRLEIPLLFLLKK
jgi:predicted alpha/beta superfamily hydrolase